MLPKALKLDDIINFPPLLSHAEVGFLCCNKCCSQQQRSRSWCCSRGWLMCNLFRLVLEEQVTLRVVRFVQIFDSSTLLAKPPSLREVVATMEG